MFRLVVTGCKLGVCYGQTVLTVIRLKNEELAKQKAEDVGEQHASWLRKVKVGNRHYLMFEGLDGRELTRIRMKDERTVIRKLQECQRNLYPQPRPGIFVPNF